MTRSLPLVEADIRRAATIPGWFYRDAELFAACREKIFARSWQFVGDADQVRVPGQVQPVELLPGCLDEPLVLTRDVEDRLHCLSNVCTHRGHRVVEAPGKERSLRCRYHGRRFGLDGCFQHMPECADAVDFPSDRDHLPKVQLERWGKLLFASLDPAWPFQDLIGELDRRVGWLPIDEMTFDAARSRDYLVRAHWALYCDNYLEGFHIPFVHGDLAAALDYGSYRTELFPLSSLQLGVASGAEEVFDLPSHSPDTGQQIAAYYWWLFPNTMLNVYPWGISVNVVEPLAVDRTRVRFLSYVWDESKIDGSVGAMLDRVEREDEEVVENVHRGVGSRLYHRGRFSPSREQGVHHFHRLLVEALTPPGSRWRQEEAPP